MTVSQYKRFKMATLNKVDSFYQILSRIIWNVHVHKGLWWVNTKARDRLEDLGRDGKII
jgi:hypothetical protein